MASKKGKIRKPKASPSRLVSIPEPQDYDKKTPAFSLARIQSGNFCFSALEVADKAAFSEAIFRRRDLTWAQIKSTNRHGLGCENIPKHSIKAPIPKFITEDVDHFMAFRFNGMKAMVGYRINDIFYVLWFDPAFSLYNHGS